MSDIIIKEVKLELKYKSSTDQEWILYTRTGTIETIKSKEWEEEKCCPVMNVDNFGCGMVYDSILCDLARYQHLGYDIQVVCTC